MQIEKSPNKEIVENAASQNENWVVAVANFKADEPIILQHMGKMQSTLQLLKDDEREVNEKGVDEALAELVDKWQAEARSDDDTVEEIKEGDEGSRNHKRTRTSSGGVESKHEWDEEETKRRIANQGKRQAEESRNESKETKRVRTTFDDEEG